MRALDLRDMAPRTDGERRPGGISAAEHIELARECKVALTRALR
ncbi:MAG: hypothetical protein U0531_06185 [Dehalococcoidia bacterium]